METQLAKLYEVYQAEPDPLRKNMFLSDLQNRNETLFFRLLIKHMAEMGASFMLLRPLSLCVCSQRLQPCLARSAGRVHADCRARVPEVRQHLSPPTRDVL